jgi:prepilin signal peptidase PulO-like enzyme (type II secretory pathway)
LLDLLTACWFGVFGACIGSFINVVAYRMPRGMSIVWKPSHCPKCGRDIRARDNLPVFGWLLLRGRCRACSAPISPRYAIVEAIMGAAFVALAYAELFSGAANIPGGPLVEPAGAWDVVWNPKWPIVGLFAFHAALLSLLMAMTLVDQDQQRAPWPLVAVAVAIVLASAWAFPAWYPERTRTTRIVELKAPLDALCGAAWGALPSLAILGATRRRIATGRQVALLNIAAALGVTGAFLGLRPAVRITLALILAVAAINLLARGKRVRISPLAPLWLAVLVHLIVWKQVAPLLNW